MRQVALIAAAGALVAGMSFGACSKQPRETRAAGVKPAAGEQAPPTPPSMYEAIPADTPYVVASIDPGPDALWEPVRGLIEEKKDEVGSMVEKALGAEDTPVQGRVFLVALEEIVQTLGDEDFAEELGLQAEPDVVIYGLGALPVVRLEIGDAEALRDTVGRIEEQSGAELPTRDIAGHDLWWFSEGGDAAAVAILGDEVVATFGAPEAVEAGAEVLVGARELGPTLSESDLRDLAEAQGASGLGFAHLDIRRLAGLLLGAGEGVQAEITAALGGGAPHLPEACAKAVDGALAHMPSAGFGYSELTAERAAMEGRIELSEELSELVGAAQTRVPGMTGSFEDPPLFAIGAALDIRAAGRVLERIGRELDAVGKACDEPEIRAAAAELTGAGSGAIPPPLSSIRGGMLVVQSLEPAMMRGEGYALAGIDQPAALLRLARSFVPQLADIEVPSDGAFRPLPPQLTEMIPVDLGLSFAIGDSAVALAAGESGKSGAESAMAAEPDVSPLFMTAYDYGALIDLGLGAMAAEGVEADQPIGRAFAETLSSYLGPATSSVTPGEQGLKIRGEFEMRPDALSE